MGARRGTALVVLHEPVAGGATLAIRRLEQLLREDGWQIAYWAVEGGPVWEDLSHSDMEAAAAPRPFAFSLRGLREPPGPMRRATAIRPYLGKLRSFARAVGADVVHANTVLSGWEALALRRAGLPVVVHVHEMLGRGPKDRAAAALLRRAASETVAVSRATAAALGRLRVDARVVHGGVEVGPGPPADRDSRERPIVGTVGTVTRRKGSDLFVEAAERLAAEDEISFQLAGATRGTLEVDWARKLVTRAQFAGVTHHESADVPALLADWDIFVLPSRADPFPNVVLEAMAAGLPVVASEVDGIPEQVTPATGILVPPNDAAALSRAIADLASDPARRLAMGIAGRARVEREFTLERQATGISRAWQDALSSPAS